MSRVVKVLAAAGLVLATTAAQAQERNVQIQFLGGGYSHTANLSKTGADAHFKQGFNLETAVGVMASKYVGVHADFTFARTKGLGNVDFAGKKVDRFFYGGHVELRYPVNESVAPFVFGGAGAVTIDQQGPTADDAFGRFTKPAAMFGAGMAMALPNAPVDVLLQGKALTYKWEAAGFNRQQWDVTYSIGFAYRFGF
ncbi:MAG: outer membrane beta-barrel protein [Gemmatimonadales bacterium]